MYQLRAAYYEALPGQSSTNEIAKTRAAVLVVGAAAHPALGIPTATALAIMAMQVTRTLHPPAGGTVLIAFAGGAKARSRIPSPANAMYAEAW